jgi:hypothetical protein
MPLSRLHSRRFESRSHHSHLSSAAGVDSFSGEAYHRPLCHGLAVAPPTSSFQARRRKPQRVTPLEGDQAMRLSLRIFGAGLASLAVLLAGANIPTAGAVDKPPAPVTRQRYNSVDPVLQAGDGAVAAARNSPNPVCTTPTAPTPNNISTDCENPDPHNETSIAVNPTNPLNLIGGANDYQISLSPGGTIFETIFTRAHVSSDGGKTWAMVPVNSNAYVATGDPAVAFDANGKAYIATLGFLFSQGLFCCTAPDVVVATSSDGGRDWTAPVRVAAGTGTFTSPAILNDKEYITAWGDGNAVVTWTQFNDVQGGATVNSPIMASVSHDGGARWSAGVEISGSAPFCTADAVGTACDQDQFSVPVVTSDGRIFVAFENEISFATGRDQYLVVEIDPATGHRIAGPFQVASLIDGFTDFPVNIDGRQTYQDSEFRSNSSGNIAADPTTPGHLAVIFSDMRNSSLPAPSDPYQAKTNADVSISQSFDAGQTWSRPATIRAGGDQFQPWGAYDTAGRLRIGYFDRSYDPANHKYGYTLATETSSGSLSFKTTQLTTVLSNPTQNTRWFSGRTPNPAFPHPTTFLGDYSGITKTAAGGVLALWTDLRNQACFPSRCGSGEDAFFTTAN